MRNRRILSLIGALAVFASLAVGPTFAFGQDQLSNPSAAQYDPGVPGVSGTGESGSTSGGTGAAASTSGGGDDNLGSLPFTGMDLIIVAGVALVLVGTGAALRRLSVPGPRG